MPNEIEEHKIFEINEDGNLVSLVADHVDYNLFTTNSNETLINESSNVEDEQPNLNKTLSLSKKIY